MLHEIETYLKRTGTAPTKFGRLVAKDSRLVGDMRNGREPHPKMKAKVKAFMEAKHD